ncbi:MAG: hypothetical protein PVF97_00750, partial [Desulfobacterales bacterium]
MQDPQIRSLLYCARLQIIKFLDQANRKPALTTGDECKKRHGEEAAGMTDDPKPQKPTAHRSATRDVRQADGGAAGVPLGDMDTESSAVMTSRGEKAANAIDNGGPSPSSATGKDEIIRGRIMEKFEELERHPASVPT